MFSDKFSVHEITSNHLIFNIETSSESVLDTLSDLHINQSIDQWINGSVHQRVRGSVFSLQQLLLPAEDSSRKLKDFWEYLCPAPYRNMNETSINFPSRVKANGF